jgi:hypothetical protein
VPGFALGQWRHFAISFESINGNSGVIRLYLNGALAATDPSVTLNMSSDKFAVFGGHGSTSFAVTRWFNGRLDDCAIFNGLLSVAEISQLAARPAGYLGGASRTNTVAIDISLPEPPRLTITRISSVQFLLNVSGTSSGPDYHVETSTNLLDWTSVFATNAPAFAWSDPETNSRPRKFYRVRVEP